LALSLSLFGVGFAILRTFAAPPKHGEPRVSDSVPAPAKPSTTLRAPSGPDMAVAKPPADKATGAPVAVASTAEPRPNGKAVSRVLTPSTESTSMLPADKARAPARSPIEYTQTPEPLNSIIGVSGEAVPLTAAPARPDNAKDGPISQERDRAAQETLTPPANATQAPAPAPVEQTPLPTPSNKKEAAPAVPAWLRAHVGEQDGQIAEVVFQRARALYQEKVRNGQVRNACYFAMDATRPNSLEDGKPGRRFYIICESDRMFRAIPSGHGSGRKLKGVVDFSNGRTCAKNFGNALDSKLTAGGAYLTSETKTSFKGYYQLSAKNKAPFSRTFVQYDGEGGTANARERQIGGHAAEVLKGVCRLKDPKSPYADHDGYVLSGKLVDYSSGRSDGCTSWSPSDAKEIIAIVKGNSTTLYVYPEETDIDAVARAVAADRSLRGASLYWNKSCLKEIGAPRFWSKEALEPVLAQYKRDHPALPAGPIPICKK
jgi:hypothetical protein